MSIPAWLKRLLSEQNPDGITRRIRARRCTKCAAITLRGLDGDVAALPARVDPEPISADGELAALLTGRRTYTLRTDGDRLQLDHRDRWHISGKPAGVSADVHAEHVCGKPLPTAPSITPVQIRAEETTCPPF